MTEFVADLVSNKKGSPDPPERVLLYESVSLEDVLEILSFLQDGGFDCVHEVENREIWEPSPSTIHQLYVKTEERETVRKVLSEHGFIVDEINE